MIEAFADVAEVASEIGNFNTETADKVLDRMNNFVSENEKSEPSEIYEEKYGNDIAHAVDSVLDKFNNLMDSDSEIDSNETDVYNVGHSESLLDKFNESMLDIFDKSNESDNEDKSPEIKPSITNNRFECSGFLPRKDGEWSGEAGNSTWKPAPDVTPQEKSRNTDKPYSNPDNLSWGELMEKYKIDGIPFVDGEPDFSEVARGTVEIDDFTDDRDSNFSQADEKMAEQRGCTPEEVAKWRKDNNYTWHECKDCKTMQKVPNEIHANVPHSGGVSEYKSQNNNV